MKSEESLRLCNLRFVQVETSNYCNYRCPYCPIAYEPKPRQFMSPEQFQRVIEQLETLPALETIYLNGYNEPTLVPEIVEQVRMAARLGTNLVILTNATGLTYRKLDELSRVHPRLTVDIHLSAISASEYRLVHGIPLHSCLLQRLHRIAENRDSLGVHVKMMVMGKGDAQHRENWEEVRDFFVDTGMDVGMDVVHDRAGALPLPYHQGYRHGTVVGCALDNRYSEWIHVTVKGDWVLCCQDYDEQYVFGNVFQQSVREIAESARRRIVIEEAKGRMSNDKPSICQKCHYAVLDAS